MQGFDIQEQAIASTPTGMAPPQDAAVFVLQPGHQTPLDAADPFARAVDYVSYSDDPIENRRWRYDHAAEVQTFINTGELPDLMGAVRMINSVGEHVAGEEVELDDSEADRFIVLGYAEGELSAEVAPDMRAAIEATAQVVSLGG